MSNGDDAVLAMFRLKQLPPDSQEEDWHDRAVCAQSDPEIWFPQKGGSTRKSKSICMSCPVQQECLEYALEHDERFGVWGGYSEKERRRMQRGEHVPPYLGPEYRINDAISNGFPAVREAQQQEHERQQRRKRARAHLTLVEEAG